MLQCLLQKEITDFLCLVLTFLHWNLVSSGTEKSTFLRIINDSPNNRKKRFGMHACNGDLTPTYDQGVNTSPVSHLSYGKSLGDTLNGKPLYKVLSKVTVSSNKPLPKHLSSELKAYLRANIGLRARMIRIFNSSCDPAPIQRALSHGQKLCEGFGMTGEHAIEFRDFYGRLLRKTCTFAMLMKKNGDTFEAKRLAVTTFVFVWQLLEMQYRMRTKLDYQQTFPSKENRYRRGLQVVPMDKYKVRQNDWNFVSFIYGQSEPSRVIKKHNGEL